MAKRFWKVAALATYAFCVNYGWSADDRAAPGEADVPDNTKVSGIESVEDLIERSHEIHNTLVRSKRDKKKWFLCPLSEGQHPNETALQLAEEVIIAPEVEGLEWGVFRGASNLKTVRFPADSKVQIICDNAFYTCKSLQSIQIPTSVRVVGFLGVCDNLEEITFEPGSKLEIIGVNAFARCKKLKFVNFDPENPISSLAEGTFRNCAIESINIPYNVEFIKGDTFSGCRSLTSVNFADKSKLQGIGSRTLIPLDGYGGSEPWREEAQSTFYRCALQSISIPRDVEFIGVYAFAQCRSLKTIAFAGDSKLTEIGYRAFRETGLERVQIPAAIVSIGEHAFEDCLKLKEVNFAQESPIRTIEEGTFWRCALEAINIPDNVELIKKRAFYLCKSLKAVTFADESNLREIGDGAFEGTALESMQIPATVTYIRDYAFAKSALGAIDIPRSVELIGARAFAQCKSLRTVTFTDESNLREIGEGAFEGTALESMQIPATVTRINGNTFAQCKSLRTVTFADGSNLGEIGPDAFCGSAIESVQIPATVVSICERAFKDCSNLQVVNFDSENSIETLKPGIFANSAIESIDIPRSVKVLGYWIFSQCKSLRTVTFAPGSNLREIGGHAFESCDSLEQITLPDSVTCINYGAFYGTKLSLNLSISSLGKGITIPEMPLALNSLFTSGNIADSSIRSEVTVRNVDGSMHSKWLLNDRKEWVRVKLKVPLVLNRLCEAFFEAGIDNLGIGSKITVHKANKSRHSIWELNSDETWELSYSFQ